jgi:type II secretory pathway pseudopilin PulG
MSYRPSPLRLGGFTLVEVVAALGAFAIAFLAGFAAIGALMIRQDINYRATVAASAAMLLIQKATLADTAATVETEALNNAALLMTSKTYKTTGPNVKDGMKYRGFPVSDAADIISGTTNLLTVAYTFKTPGFAPPPPAGFTDTADLAEYRPIIMTPIPGKKMLFWYGAPEEIENDRATTLDYLGGYSYVP